MLIAVIGCSGRCLRKGVGEECGVEEAGFMDGCWSLAHVFFSSVVIEKKGIEWLCVPAKTSAIFLEVCPDPFPFTGSGPGRDRGFRDRDGIGSSAEHWTLALSPQPQATVGY